MLCLALAAALAASPPSLSENDQARLDAFDAHKANALRVMRSEGEPADAAIVEALFDSAPTVSAPADLYGVWDCRTIKLGGKDFGLPVIIYDWFECRITRHSDGLRFRKITGSQRTEGFLYATDGPRWLYAGASRYHYEAPQSYGQGVEKDQVAYLSQLSKDHVIMEFPDPYYESEFNIIELRR